jgi:hypothetical protein
MRSHTRNNKEDRYMSDMFVNVMKSVEHEDVETLDTLLYAIESPDSQIVAVLNELLMAPWHRSHQRVAKLLQQTASPTTVPYVKKVLENGFDFLKYTASDSHVIAKWFSWLLFAIGTREAIDLMQEYAASSDGGIAREMKYRLSKVAESVHHFRK